MSSTPPENTEKVLPRLIETEMRDSFLSYSMSVIVQRALPDVRDGLKPVHRRILYAMQEAGLSAGRAYRKSATVVGDVLGKYHPHGDSSVYEAMVRMVQDFSLRYPLVDGQGNFGSIDGDNAAAYRYTEARLARLAGELLADIDKNTVDTTPNFDDRLQEPKVLPAKFPNLLVNGSSGIAVGMATNIPPHNLREVVNACVHFVDHEDATVQDLMQHIQGPDFPTGGYICGREGVHEAYTTGRGRVVMRAKALIEEPDNAKPRIIVTEIPFMVNKSRMIEQIAGLVREKKLSEITDLRDESDRDGIRVVIELRRDAIPQIVLNQLYKHTQLQSTFGVIMLALVNGVPKIMDLREMIQHFVEHRHQVVIRRSQFDLDHALDREHILEGLKIAVDNIDEVVALIRASTDTESANAALQERFGLSERQAKAILDMRLGRLTGLEIDKLEAELTDVRAQIADLREILANRGRRMQIIKDELTEIAATYGDDRRTELTNMVTMSLEDLLADEEMVITVSHGGYIKRLPLDTYRAQKRGGRGLTGASTKEEDWVEHLYTAQTHDYLMIFTARGHCYWLKVHEIPEASRASRGKPIVNLLALDPDERIASIVPVREFRDDRFLLFASRKGVVKKTALSAYRHVRVKGVNAINITEDDELIDVQITGGNDEVILATYEGMAIRFHESDVREMGRVATGVRGIRLRANDAVVGMVVIREDVRDTATLLIVTERGRGKRTAIDDYRFQSRGGMGVINFRINEQTGKIVAIKGVQPDDELMLISRHGIVTRQRVAEIRVIGRATQGVRVMALDAGDVLMDVARVVPEDDSENGTDAAEQPVTLDEGDPTDARAIVDEDDIGDPDSDITADIEGLSIEDDASRFDEEDLSGTDATDGAEDEEDRVD
ncbi:MAG TPA: DNA gyrase subunit A [Longimicrobiales bacterium]|nr:DNA gyrase subunit A [Longimicrobiales bacterium]